MEVYINKSVLAASHPLHQAKTVPIAGGVTPSTSGSTTTSTNFAIFGASAGPSGEGASTSRYYGNLSASLNASWELDFWGLFRRNVEAADATLNQTVNNYDEMLVLLLANVATQYIEIATRGHSFSHGLWLRTSLVLLWHSRHRIGGLGLFLMATAVEA